MGTGSSGSESLVEPRPLLCMCPAQVYARQGRLSPGSPRAGEGAGAPACTAVTTGPTIRSWCARALGCPAGVAGEDDWADGKGWRTGMYPGIHTGSPVGELSYVAAVTADGAGSSSRWSWSSTWQPSRWASRWCSPCRCSLQGPMLRCPSSSQVALNPARTNVREGIWEGLLVEQAV